MPTILYLPDAAVDADLDLELRTLLSACFTRPHHAVFREHRHFRHPPQHRWLMRDESGRLSAQVAVHERRVEAAQQSWAAGGLAEVCVHPDVQRRGLMRRLLARVHQDLHERGVAFAVLFGDPAVYGSSGYYAPLNVSIGPDAEGRWEHVPRALVRVLGEQGWPTGDVRVPGSAF